MSELKEIERAASRLERAMDEAYSRHLGGTEEQCIEGVAAAVRQTLDTVPENARPFLLEMLAERYEPDAPRGDERTATELAGLKMENDRLRHELDAVRQRPSRSAVIAEALLGDAAGADAGAAEEAEFAAAVRALREFTLTLAENFLGPVGKKAGKQETSERVLRALAAQLAGEDPAAWSAVLEELKTRIAAHLGAVRPACREGGLFLLQQLDPGVLEGEEGVGQAQGLGSLFANRERDLWRVFERRYAKLVRDEELYETYFAPYYNKWLHDISRGKRSK